MHLQWAKTNDNISLGCIPHQNYDEKLDSSNKQTTVCQITAWMALPPSLTHSRDLEDEQELAEFLVLLNWQRFLVQFAEYKARYRGHEAEICTARS